MIATHQHTIGDAYKFDDNTFVVVCGCGATAKREVLPWNGEVKWTGWFKADSWTSRTLRRAADKLASLATIS